MSRVFLACFLLLGLASCESHTPVRVLQSQCQAAYPVFKTAVGCLRQATSVPPYSSGHPSSQLVQLYVAYAEAVALRVDAGQITVADANYLLAEFYNRMNTTEDQRIFREQAGLAIFLQGMAAYQAAVTPRMPTPPQMITCSVIGNIIRCN